MKVDGGEAEFVDALPDIFGRHAEFPDDLVGATVARIGTIPGQHVEGGGLVIEYRPLGSTCVRRAVFGFNDCGMWVESVKHASS
jgi:hypothetical protein